MLVVLCLFILAMIIDQLYLAYRKKVPTPYDFYIDEYTYTTTTRPGAIRYVGKWGDAILPHEQLFIWLDGYTLKRRGYDSREAFFLERGSLVTEIRKTNEFKQRLDQYRDQFQEAFDENSGEAEVDPRMRPSVVPFTYRRISFSPKA